MASHGYSGTVRSSTEPVNTGLQHSSQWTARGVASDASRFENVQATGSSRQHNGNAYNNTVNNYAALTPHGSVPVKPPEDPIHSDLMRACREGQGPRRLSFLLGRGANVGHRDQQQITPLHQAASSGSVHTLRYLIEAGADVHAGGERISTPLFQAAASGSAEAVWCLIDAGADVHVSDTWIGTPLHHAAFNGSADTICCLLEAGADIQAFGKWVGTPLSVAAARSHLGVIRVLLERNADVNQGCGYFGSAAHMACAAGDLDVLQVLKQASASFHKTSSTCHATYCDVLDPEHRSLPSSLGSRRLGRALVLVGAPGILAISHGRLEAAELCLDMRLNFEVMGFYTVSWYTEQGWRRPSREPPGPSTNLSVEALDIDMLQLLVERGIDPRPRYSGGQSPVLKIGLCKTRQLDGQNASACVSLLLQYGAHNSCADIIGDKDMFLMATLRRDDGDLTYWLAKAILDHGSPVNYGNYAGETALMIAAGTEYKSRVRCVELLCEYGAYVDWIDNRGRTALRYAEKWGGSEDYEEVKRILEHYGQNERNRLPAWEVEMLCGNVVPERVVEAHGDESDEPICFPEFTFVELAPNVRWSDIVDLLQH